MRAILYVSTLVFGILLTLPAFAQTDTEESEKGEGAETGDATAPAEAAGPEGAAEPQAPDEQEAKSDEDQAFLTDTEEAEIEAPEVEKDVGLDEDPKKPYFSVGLRARWIMIPEWFIKIFGVDTTRPSGTESALPLISNIGVGPEFTYRKDGFDITVAVWYAGLGWDDPISFKGSDNDGNSWEVVENSLNAILITADFIWSTSFTNWFAITYGAGLGAGITWGDVIRTEATQLSSGARPCVDGENDPDPWCQPDEEYGIMYDKLKVVPWIELLLGVRFKPHRNVAIYIDGGFGLGFQMGGRVGYIF